MSDISKVRTAWAVWCLEEKKQYFLTEEAYLRQLDRPDSTWRCPGCGDEANWDDENYKAFLGIAEPGYTSTGERIHITERNQKTGKMVSFVKITAHEFRMMEAIVYAAQQVTLAKTTDSRHEALQFLEKAMKEFRENSAAHEKEPTIYMRLEPQLLATIHFEKNQS